jgi:cytidylate kinase
VQVICLSRGAFVGGEELAVQLAHKLGYPCLSREELVEAATEDGILVGKLEMAITRRRTFSERLALERDHYLAFVTARICDRAMNGGLVYHGRTGHMILPGITHVLRVRVVTGEESRIQAAVQRLGVDRGKARRYLEEVDDDWRRWIRSVYGVSWEDAARYDVTLNLDNLSVSNAAAALTAMAQLPDFQMTPASRKMMLDLGLGARCRLALADAERTCKARFKVHADAGMVTVSYLPHDAPSAEAVVEVVAAVDGVTQVRTTMATTNILWVQETFDPSSETFRDVVEIATKWNAAIELVRLGSDQDVDPGDLALPQGAAPEDLESQPATAGYDGGIEDDVEEPPDDGGVAPTLDEIALHGRSGGGHTVAGGARELLASLDRSTPYSLVVLGEVFKDRGHAARIRMKRELQSFLSDQIKAPVVVAEELKQQFLFGRRDIARALVCLAVTVVPFAWVFTHQPQVLRFLLGDWWAGSGLGHVVVAAVVFTLVPIIAFAYGTLSKILLKLIGIE